ncbi:MAG: UDP-N-acetylmuramoyl-tripeptide--D-alanyl-D-alanine ligase [Oscillospiraceae bacterium]|nr:UDP-N-acetylmuramoyl-tripeptide--D-alanyl-D-alanine ligase [Oscillospiraceae bacterium]
MKTLTPIKIAEVTGGEYFGSTDEKRIPVSGAVRDNRDVKPGNLFICIKGARADGHSYANSAFESGAACCLAEQEIPNAKGPYVIVKSTLEAVRTLGEYYRSLFTIPLVGITGSVGKTTAKEIIGAVLGAKLNVLKTKMNMNNELGVPLTLLSLNERHEAAVIEMGIRDFGDMSILAQMVRPDIFVMTKIGYSHIVELGDLQGVLRAKTEAFAYMKPDGIAVLNGDDELLLGFDPKMRKLTFGLEEYNDVRAVNVHANSVDSVEFDIVSDKSNFHVKLPAYGSHLASLAPAAVIVGQLLGLTDEEICKGFTLYEPVEGRSNVSNINGITLIDDCYNANPNSVKAALTSISALPGRHVAILGDMLNLGEHTVKMHHEVGMFAAQTGINCLLCQGDLSNNIYKGFVSNSGINAKHYKSMEELMEEIPVQIKKGDAILVKASRGMHFERLLPIISGSQHAQRKS